MQVVEGVLEVQVLFLMVVHLLIQPLLVLLLRTQEAGAVVHQVQAVEVVQELVVHLMVVMELLQQLTPAQEGAVVE
jgi:hypothetical protein